MKSIQKLKDLIECEIAAARTIEDLNKLNEMLKELNNEFHIWLRKQELTLK